MALLIYIKLKETQEYKLKFYFMQVKLFKNIEKIQNLFTFYTQQNINNLNESYISAQMN
ncbi:hypothetical protein TTHERM_000478113 (macronuclear) [Tetrahymena thermophila SB210]|uniref:Uncharacterized protein n=1 Tax=Tetrahymena thermophila (strain SB210) TaxID=312017 RepID=W7X424_TETTS|nr:hypothetical protein TTHERM_000478113 [Tetrahymena thermophila SB210]EWS74065.1 hypothetical protein TTHERM_000478113 [Tetrahymena thermophila SB210]|eukprot:XP_012653398.1 hypothetical protein TTHERM_000478113 [Tetrahymena thermophila SB210]